MLSWFTSNLTSVYGKWPHILPNPVCKPLFNMTLLFFPLRAGVYFFKLYLAHELCFDKWHVSKCNARRSLQSVPSLVAGKVPSWKKQQSGIKRPQPSDTSSWDVHTWVTLSWTTLPNVPSPELPRQPTRSRADKSLSYATELWWPVCYAAKANWYLYFLFLFFIDGLTQVLKGTPK